MLYLFIFDSEKASEAAKQLDWSYAVTFPEYDREEMVAAIEKCL